MTPTQFKKWRKSLHLKQKEAADLLGLKKRVIQYYETGVRDGKELDIPRSIRLACYALSQGVRDFDGEASVLAKDGQKKEGPKKEGQKEDDDTDKG